MTIISVDRCLLQETVCLTAPTFPLASLERATNNSNQVKKEIKKASLKNNFKNLSSHLLRFCACFLENNCLKCYCLHSYTKVAGNFQKENTTTILLNSNYIIFNNTFMFCSSVINVHQLKSILSCYLRKDYMGKEGKYLVGCYKNRKLAIKFISY